MGFSFKCSHQTLAGGAAVGPLPKCLPHAAATTGRGLHNHGNGESGFDPGEAVSGALAAWGSLLTLHHLRSTTQAPSHPCLPPWDHTPFPVPRALAWLPWICDCFVTCCIVVNVTLLCLVFLHFPYLPILHSALHSFIPCTLVLIHHVTHI